MDTYTSKLTKIMSETNSIVEKFRKAANSERYTSRLLRDIEDAAARLNAFQKATALDQINSISRYIRKFDDAAKAWTENAKDALLLIPASLRDRGWYLSGHEYMGLSIKLVKAIREQDWITVDNALLEQVPEYNKEELIVWLEQNSVPKHTNNRLLRFLTHHTDGNYEEATFIGIPLLDEIAGHFFDKKAFTTSRGRRKKGVDPKPEIAYKSTDGVELTEYANSFVETLGCLQRDTDQSRLSDPDYWNRHAIVHGQMQRSMGIKDSAKCVMAINFLLFGRDGGTQS